MEEANSRKRRALVIGTGHEFQRHQDEMPDREKVRAEFDQHLRQVIEERKIQVIVEEAGGNEEAWKNLKQNDKLGEKFVEDFRKYIKEHENEGGDRMAAALEELLGNQTSVERPAPTIAKTIAHEYGVRHEDIDVEVRAKEGDSESIEKRSDAMTAKTMEVSGDATSILVIVGGDHRPGMAGRLADQGFAVDSERFPK